MKITKQLKIAFIEVPLSLTSAKQQTIKWMTTYFIFNLLLFSVFSWALLNSQEVIKNVLLDYFFPESWQKISETLGNFLFNAQAKVVLGNLIISGALIFTSIFLFPVKEKCSAVFEKEAQYSNGSNEEFSLTFQAWEETKLLLFYLTAQSVILWIGYYPYQWTTLLSITLSYLFLFFSFGLDFISPTLQRHRIKYSHILKTLFKIPCVTINFGLLFCLPVLIISQAIFELTNLSVLEIASILFLANILFLTLAIPAGTHAASRLMPVVKKIRPPARKNKIMGYTGTLLLLTSFSFLHGKLIFSLHHKSQLLKADYEIDWSSITYRIPSISQILSEKSPSNLSFDIIINNPTEHDITIEDSEIFITKKYHAIATMELTGFSVPSGKTRKITIKIDSLFQLNNLTNIKEILSDWHINLHLQLLPGIPFILSIT